MQASAQFNMIENNNMIEHNETTHGQETIEPDYASGQVSLYRGDSRDVVKSIASNSLDSCVCDPPYALVSITKRFGKDGAALAQFGSNGLYQRASAGFMGKDWDTGEVAFDPAFWADVYRTLKPGAMLAAFGGTRSYHRLACAIEDAGFEIRDSIGYGSMQPEQPTLAAYCYGSGFPKSHNISKAIDRHLGAHRKQVQTPMGAAGNKYTQGLGDTRPWRDAAAKSGFHEHDSPVPVTDEAVQWEGWGSALKPSWEPIVIARKPLSEKSLAENVLKWGCGGINIDASRVGSRADTPKKRNACDSGIGNGGNCYGTRTDVDRNYTEGRWPANTIISPGIAIEMDKQSGISKGGEPCDDRGTGGIWSKGDGVPCGPQYGDTGGASRFFPVLGFTDADMPFFYTSKPSQVERNLGCEGLSGTPVRINAPRDCEADNLSASQSRGNSHPTLKPVSVLSWLSKLLTPPGGTILDPFMGSGSGGMAAINDGFSYVGIEREQEYFDIAVARLKHSECKTGLFAE